MTLAPPPGPSSTPVQNPRERLATLLTQIDISQNLPADLKKSLKDRIERLQAEEQQNQLDQTKLTQIEKEFQDLEGSLRVDLPTGEKDSISALRSALEGTNLLAGAAGQQAMQVIQKMGKWKKVLYKIANALDFIPGLKDWLKKSLPESVQQEMEREDLGNKIFKSMKNRLQPVIVVKPRDEDIPRYVEKLQNLYQQVPQPKPVFETWYEVKITKLPTQYPGRRQYSLDDLVRLAVAESSPRNAQQQQEQKVENEQSLKGRKKRAYAFALVKAFNDAAGSEVVSITPLDNENNEDYARRIGTALANALKVKAFRSSLALELDTHLEATDTTSSGIMGKILSLGMADYNIHDQRAAAGVKNFGYNLKHDPEKAFNDFLKIDSTPLNTRSQQAVDAIQASLITAQRTIDRDFGATSNAGTETASSAPYPAPTQTASATPPTTPATSSTPPPAATA